MTKHKESLIIEQEQDDVTYLDVTTIAFTPVKEQQNVGGNLKPKLSFSRTVGYDGWRSADYDKVREENNDTDRNAVDNSSTIKEIVPIKKVKSGTVVSSQKLKVTIRNKEGKSKRGKKQLQVWKQYLGKQKDIDGKSKPKRQRQPCSLKLICSSLLQMCVGVGVIGLLYFQANISFKMFKAFRDSPESFTVDTLNLHWNSTFPGITICQVFNGERNWELSERYYGEDRDKRLDDLIIDITYFSGTCYSCELCQQDLRCPTDFNDLVSKFRSNCNDMIGNCTWNQNLFDCCDKFLPLETEYGTCYTINSANTKPPATEMLISNRRTGPSSLEFTLFEDVQIFIHPPNEVPHAFQDHELKQTVLWGSRKEVILLIQDILDPEKESHCTKPKGFNLYNMYTASTCAIECHILAQIHFCKCIHHFMPQDSTRNVPTCTYQGLMCLTQHFADISRYRKECRCPPSCESQMISTVQEVEEEQASDYGSQIKIAQMNLPTMRYIKRQTKTSVSFMISFGGLVGLFYGISLLSAFEYMEKFVLKLKATITRLLYKPKPRLERAITTKPTTQLKPVQQRHS